MIKPFLLFLLLLFGGFQTNNAARDKALESMANAERAFSAASVKNGIKAAFLENLADDAIVFLPGPVNGKEGYGKQPESPAKLSWYPAYADISASPDWGYTTGPYELRPKPEDEKPTGAGFYLSVWKKQADGKWKVAVDMGNSFSPDLIKKVVYQPTPPAKGKAAKGTEAQLLQQDTATTQAYHPETIVYRAGVYPYHFKEKTTKSETDVTYTTLGHDISPAADMAFTYGSYTRGSGEQAESGYYLKVWKVLEGKWQLAAHNLVPGKK
ncbi:YybH family protein [Pontibacter ruber]|uniref:YybH family protein n=1 Tax=Pontibacter ruber TaxID=1343895 RepID=A0ABW5CZX6_9BACT|nr:DUF4440 domain-containing protein [Pontibacter ruber]